MPTSFTLQQLHDIGGWTFAALALGAMLYSMVKGHIVPRFLYDEQRDRADRAIEGQEKSVSTVERLTKAIEMLTSSLVQRGSRHE